MLDSSRGSEPRIGVVIPVFAHSELLIETIESVLDQDIDVAYRIVVVDDGCNFVSTKLAGLAALARGGGMLHYIRQANGGLSAARNKGVEFLLLAFPQLEAIYFLDADNRLERYSLAAYWSALLADPQASWSYPDITYFGLVDADAGFRVAEVAPHYSPLLHLMDNTCEAGSMVRTDLFRHGLRFDETMLQGYEDWEFWWQALQAGHRGTRVADAGFRYRRRPESMVSGSNRVRGAILNHMLRKHSALVRPGHLLRIEHQEKPRYALISIEDASVTLTSDPALPGRVLGLDEFVELSRNWLLAPEEHFYPDFLLFSTPAVRSWLTGPNPYSRWMLWSLSQTEQPAVSARWAECQAVAMTDSESVLPDPRLVFCRSSALAERVVEAGDNGELLESSTLPSRSMHFDIPRRHRMRSELSFTSPADELLGNYLWFIRRLSALARISQANHMHRSYSGPDHRNVSGFIAEQLDLAEQTPAPVVGASGQSSVLLVQAAGSARPLDDTVARLIALLRARHCIVNLLLLTPEPAPLHETLQSAFDSIFPLNRPDMFRYDGRRRYGGRRLYWWTGAGDHMETISLAASHSAVVSINAPAILGIFGRLKRQHVKCLSFVHEDVFADGATAHDNVGHYLAYEHAHTGFLCESAATRARLAAEGVPLSKAIDISSDMDAVPDLLND